MKKLAVLAVCFAALAAFVYFYEISGAEEREKTKQLEASLLGAEQGDITAIQIVRKEKPVVRLEKSGDSWMVREPYQSAADKDAVDSLLSNLTSAKRDRVLEEPGLDLASFGLADPALELQITAKDKTRTVLVGKKDYSGSSLYVKLKDESPVLLTSTLFLSSAEKDAVDWRTKAALLFDRAKTEAIRIQRGKETLELERKDERWQLVQPVADLGDESTVSGLLSALEFGKAKTFVEEQPADLAKYGLAEPQVVVRVREQGKDSWQQLDIGSQTGEDYYARDPQRAPVFTVGKDLVENLQKGVWDFRDKDVINVKQDQISELSLKRGDEEILLRQEEYKWTFEKPDSEKGKEALGYKFWYPLDDIKYTELLESNAELGQVKAELTLRLKDSSEHRYQFGQTGTGWVARQLDSGRIGRISEEDAKKLEFTVADIESTPEGKPAE